MTEDEINSMFEMIDNRLEAGFQKIDNRMDIMDNRLDRIEAGCQSISNHQVELREIIRNGFAELNGLLGEDEE